MVLTFCFFGNLTFLMDEYNVRTDHIFQGLKQICFRSY